MTLREFVFLSAHAGLIMPSHGCHVGASGVPPASWVRYTRRALGVRLMRRRECRHCGRRVTTYESRVE